MGHIYFLHDLRSTYNKFQVTLFLLDLRYLFTLINNRIDCLNIDWGFKSNMSRNFSWLIILTEQISPSQTELLEN